jgi:protein O-mannosyl-transferase
LLTLFAEKSWQVNLSAAFVAICFALHPLRVESVAWATERRDVLSGLFYLWTIYFYLRAHSKLGGALQPRQWMFAACGSYLLSLLSKATAITFPAVMVLIDIYPLRRLKWNPRQWLVPAARNVWREKIPFFALAVLFALLAIVGQERSSAVRSFARYGTAPRLAQALFGSSFYLWKTLMPTGLSPLYEIPPKIELLQPAFFATCVTTIVLSVVFYRLRRRWPAGLVCWAYYLAVLAPVLGLLPTGPQLVADRYSYLSCLSWAVLAGGGLLYCLRRCETSRSLLNAVTISLSVAGLSIAMASLTWRQTTYWRNTETLWNRVLQVDPNSSLAHYNLARYIAKKGRYDEAIFHYRQALAIRPDDADSLNNLGLLFGINGDLELAIEYFKAAIRIDPDYAKAYFNLGKVLVRQGRVNEAIASFERALQLQPGIVEIHENLGRALAMQGKKSEAAEHFETALRLLQSSKQAQLSR